MNHQRHQLPPNRRSFLGSLGSGFGSVALAAMAAEQAATAGPAVSPLAPKAPHFAPKAKRVILLWMQGGPSQMDLFDYKPKLNEMNGQELPASVRMGQRLTGMSANQASLQLAGSAFKFQQHGRSGAWVSELR